MHIQERGAGRCLTSCLLCFRSFLQTAQRGTITAEQGQVSLTSESPQAAAALPSNTCPQVCHNLNTDPEGVQASDQP